MAAVAILTDVGGGVGVAPSLKVIAGTFRLWLLPSGKLLRTGSQVRLWRGTVDNYVETDESQAAFDLRAFHGDCAGVELMINPVSGVPWAYCPVCRCTAQLDIVAPHITPQSVRLKREVADGA